MVKDIDLLRKDTEEIISVNPIEIIFIRKKNKKDEYGNFKREERKTLPQYVRIAELSHQEAEKLDRQGLSRTHIMNITARHNADIQAGDEFVFCGKKYKVEFIRKITLGGYDEENVYKMSGQIQEKNEAAQ